MSTAVKSFWNERWAKIQCKAPTKQKDYYFSDYGRIKSVQKATQKETLLRGSITIQGYRQINMKLQDDLRQGFYVHKLVAQEFCERASDDAKFVIHMDRDNLNNYYENLKWVTQREMTDFQIKQGVYKPENRKRPSHCKMNPERVRLLKRRLKEGKTKKKILAKNFGITVEQLRKIEKGIDWKYVTLDDDQDQ
ncbi:MAG: HNH endonuclease [Aureispira sp.]